MEIKRKKAKQLLEKSKKIIEEWGLKMPKSKILILDFSLGNFEKIGHIEFWVVNRKKENYCGKFIFMFSGQTCPEHFHYQKHETFFILKGKVKMIKDGEEIMMNQGDTLIMPKNTKHSFSAVENSLILEVSNASILKDNCFTDERIDMGVKNEILQ